ncbi:Hypothetical protein PHPALM_12143 [Phytophthora palmivora]|uniref:Uncharacterized protein n=1 Tax=Phytophthora palmivora TaxID=4796 RepID=A0A2P4Y0F8_9STRA|nr:Hypothetical protein PHPALM_12143 [Phytophthora palmivora]
MARLDEKVSAGHPSSQCGQLQRELDEVKREARDAERRARDAERRLHESALPTTAPDLNSPGVMTAIQGAVQQAAKVKRERAEAAAAQHLQQRQAEADAKFEA